MANQKIKVLFFTNQEEDYLADCVLIGFLHQSNVEVYQYPVKKILFKKYEGTVPIRGKGFTLYHQLEDNDVLSADTNSLSNIQDNYDLIVFSSIQRQFTSYKKYLPQLNRKRVWIMDGEDTPAMYPFHGYYWRRPSLWFVPRAHNRFLYFKREWTPETLHYLMYKLIPKKLNKWIPVPKNLKPISFSIPAKKICTTVPEKTKTFPLHIVDEELAARINGSFTGYAFDSEEAYYDDLKRSRFGITTKRSGWDCLRHYEIAANGAVICFRDLDKKPESCAPHGLIHGVNCISYTSFEDLKSQINDVDSERYQKLQKACMEWAKSYTCENQIKELLNKYFEF